MIKLHVSVYVFVYACAFVVVFVFRVSVTRSEFQHACPRSYFSLILQQEVHLTLVVVKPVVES